jgi:chromosome partitioning protein
MKNIAVVARKGGSGKTTVAVNLAIAAHRRGRRVLLADIDPQGSAAEVMRVRQSAGPEVARLTGEELVQRLRGGDEDRLAILDTPAALEDAIAHAIAVAHLSLVVVRPTFLDIAAALQTARILRSLRKPGLILLNQAPPSRAGAEPPAVKRAFEALRLMQLPVAPVALRARANYQTTLASGQSVEEMAPGNPAGEEIAQLWAYIERFAFGTRNSTAA